MATVRALKIGDEEALEGFLVQHAETTMFLRANLRQAGIEDHGERYQGSYAAAFEDGRVMAAAAHYWNGNLILGAPRSLTEVASCAVSTSGRRVQGILGAWSQVVEARRGLGLASARTRLESREQLYAINLEALRVPTALADGSVCCRLPHASELDLLAGWAADYSIEALEEPDGPELRASSRARVEAGQAEGRHWLLEAAGRPVAYTAFNAVLPDCVQVGGVFTPPELRGRGYARCAVAGSLIAARRAGALRSVLFTGEENRNAQAAYRALGYQHVGDYGILMFESPEES